MCLADDRRRHGEAHRGGGKAEWNRMAAHRGSGEVGVWRVVEEEDDGAVTVNLQILFLKRRLGANRNRHSLPAPLLMALRGIRFHVEPVWELIHLYYDEKGYTRYIFSV